MSLLTIQGETEARYRPNRAGAESSVGAGGSPAAVVLVAQIGLLKGIASTAPRLGGAFVLRRWQIDTGKSASIQETSGSPRTGRVLGGPHRATLDTSYRTIERLATRSALARL